MIFPVKKRTVTHTPSPVVCFTSYWKNTGEKEVYSDNKGHKKTRDKLVLVYDENPEYRGRSNAVVG
jgi:hypothetical protein